jgi:hypothetical protein
VLTFWPYVWQLDPGHTYDEHLVLALKTRCDIHHPTHSHPCSVFLFSSLNDALSPLLPSLPDQRWAILTSPFSSTRLMVSHSTSPFYIPRLMASLPLLPYPIPRAVDPVARWGPTWVVSRYGRYYGTYGQSGAAVCTLGSGMQCGRLEDAAQLGRGGAATWCGSCVRLVVWLFGFRGAPAHTLSCEQLWFLLALSGWFCNDCEEQPIAFCNYCWHAIILPTV